METETATVVIAAFVISFVAFIFLRYRKQVKILVATLPRDFRGALRLVLTFKQYKSAERNNQLVYEAFDKSVAKFSDRVVFANESHEWTFQEVWELSNRVANVFNSKGYKKGDVVALFMENRPEFVATWLGLSRLGIVTALVNNNLRLHPLSYSIEIVGVKCIIYGIELTEAIRDLDGYGQKENGHLKPELFSFGSWVEYRNGAGLPSKTTVASEIAANKLPAGTQELEHELAKAGSSSPMVVDKPKFQDTLLYMYTSGTTGLPKASIVTNARYTMGSIAFHTMLAVKDDDVLFTCLPLYHTAGGLCGVGQALFYGNKVVIRKKFSASKFWRECADNGVTVAQYIGELCRYLLAQPLNLKEEQSHKIRQMIGNGLRPEIWPEFVQRFNIPHISEVYGSTDGNCNCFNIDNRMGAVGFLPVWAKSFSPLAFIKVDEITGQPIRDEVTGLAIRCKPNEPGELIGKIIKNHGAGDFKGYAGRDSGESTNKKILRDVFAKGDAYFRTGDFLVMDEYGYFYFRDRAGDTYRWKGENVSTAEVETVMSTISGLKDTIVFGVKIPKTDGKAGMAVIGGSDNNLDFVEFSAKVQKALPSYAIPLFLRLTQDIETTGTHKMKKSQFQKEAFDVTNIQDPIYFFQQGKYVPLDNQLYNQILNGDVRL